MIFEPRLASVEKGFPLLLPKYVLCQPSSQCDQIGRNFAIWATFCGPRRKFFDLKVAQNLGYFLGEFFLAEVFMILPKILDEESKIAQVSSLSSPKNSVNDCFIG